MMSRKGTNSTHKANSCLKSPLKNAKDEPTIDYKIAKAKMTYHFLCLLRSSKTLSAIAKIIFLQ